MASERASAQAACLILTDNSFSAAAEALKTVLEREGDFVRIATGTPGRDGHDRLLDVFHSTKDGPGPVSIAGLDSAGWSALALAAQLPVERVALLGAMRRDRREWRCRYARANLALCTADILRLGPPEWALDTVLQRRTQGHLRWIAQAGTEANALWAKCEFSVKNAVCRFLRGEEPGKSLAENPEMCIIYR